MRSRNSLVVVYMKRMLSLALVLLLLGTTVPAVHAAEETTLAALVAGFAGEETEREVSSTELQRCLRRAAEILGCEAQRWDLTDVPLTYPLLCEELCVFLESVDYRLPCYNEEMPLVGEHTPEEQLLADAMVISRHDLAEPERVLTCGELAQILERFFILMEAESDADVLFGAPRTTVESTKAADRSYFEDTCMIGHSQVRAYSHYSDIPMHFYGVNGAKAKQGLVYTYKTVDGRIATLEGALAAENYSAVYIMYGINDCSSGLNNPDGFIQGMKTFIGLVEETQNNPEVFILSVCPVMRFLRKLNPYNTVAVYNINRMIYGVARYYGYEYLNMYEVLGDERGYLQEEIDCADGLHFGANGYERLTEYLLCHTLS